MAKHTPEVIQAGYMAEMGRARCIRVAAVMIVLGQTGTEFDEGVVERVWGDVAAVAEEYGATPDDVQAALERHEPTLAIGAV